jgi:hypothetical protein
VKKLDRQTFLRGVRIGLVSLLGMILGGCGSVEHSWTESVDERSLTGRRLG